MNVTSRYTLMACAAAIPILAASVAAHAQAVSSDQAASAQGAAPRGQADEQRGAAAGLEEIVVTAQRRGEKLQNVPIAVSVLTAQQLVSGGVTDVQSLATAVPSLTFSTNGPSGSLFVRGIGSNAGNVNQEPSVAVYVDDVYIASPTQNVFELNNVDQVAVLKGPQGTLFGRNATGGVVQITTRTPSSTPRLDAEVGYGNYDTVRGAFYATGPVAKGLTADIAFVGAYQGQGWGDDPTIGGSTYRYNDFGLRSKLLWRPDDLTSVTLSFDYAYSHDLGVNFRSLKGEFGADGQPNYIGFYNSLSDTPSSNERWTGGASARLEHDFGALRLVDIASYRQLADTYQLDEDKTPLRIVDATLSEHSRDFTEELQLLSPLESRLTWVVGAFFYRLNAGVDPAHIAGFAAAPFPYLNINSDVVTTSGSVYGQTSFKVEPNTTLTAGLRYTVERQSETQDVETVIGQIAGPFSPSQGFNKFTWRVSADHKFTPDILGYVSYNRGIKSGGFDVLSPGAPGYDPEQLDAYEAGLKTEFLDHRIRLNVAGFLYNYKNIQEEIAVTGGTITVNAAKARFYGIDADAQFAVSSHLTLNASASYLHSELLSYPGAQAYPGNPGLAVPNPFVVGNDTPEAPHFTGNIGASYAWETSIGHLAANATVSYNSGYYWDTENRLSQPSYTLVNASLLWTTADGRYGVRLWSKNLGDTRYLASGIPSSGLGDLVTPAPPRTFGITLMSHF